MSEPGRPVRLAFLVSQLRRGGAELQMIALTERLTQQGFEVDFVTRGGAGPLDETARKAGASVRSIGMLSDQRTPRTRRFARSVRTNAAWVGLARRERYDIVDAWLHPDDVVAALTRPVTGVSVVMSARLGRSQRRGSGLVGRSLEAALNRSIDVVVANAEVTAQDVRRVQGVPSNRVRIIRGGVELPPRFGAAERRAFRRCLGASEESLLIGCVGNFRTMKRQDLLIDAFSRLRPAHPRARLVLVGDGELRPQIEQQIANLGLQNDVTLFGTATDLPPLYDAFDLFVQASNSEGLPNVLLEASAASLPIVATAAGGTAEVIRDGDTGLLVPIDDIDGLTSAMDRALEDADLRRRLGSAALSLIVREYGMARFAREYADLYLEQLESSRS